MFIRIRKSLTAVTVAGSRDFGSAIWPTTRTFGGVCANAALKPTASVDVNAAAAAVGFETGLLKSRGSVIAAAATRIDGDVLPDDRGTWAGLREMQLPFFAGAEDLWCVSLRSDSAHFMPHENWLIDWRGARRWLASRCDRESIDSHLRDSGGEAWQLRGAGAGADIFPARSEAYREMLQRLKQALDPAGIFNPGRLYAWM